MTAPTSAPSPAPAPTLTAAQRTTLRAVADTVLPALPGRGDTPFWQLAASDLGVPLALEQYLSGLPAPTRSGLLGLLDALASLSFAPQSQPLAFLPGKRHLKTRCASPVFAPRPTCRP